MAVVQLEGKVYRLKLAVSASGASMPMKMRVWSLGTSGEAMVLFNDDPVYDGVNCRDWSKKQKADREYYG